MSFADGDIDVQYDVLPEGEAAVDTTVDKMVEMAKGHYGRESPKIRAAAINIINGLDPITGDKIGAPVANKDYFGMAEAIHNYVRDNIRYVKDPVGQETLSYPEETLLNSKGGDCDDMSILEMALLGSIGIVSYPVVIGMYPNHYSHVYIHIDIPPGKHRYAGQTFAADPIMREWPLGRAAPAAKVKAKKVYSNLAGIDSMPLHGYASAPASLSPQDELEATQVPAVMKSRLTDTGHRGQIMNATRLTEWGDELDEMFNAEATINPMQAAPASMLYSRGPVVARQERLLTSYLSEAPLGTIRNKPSMRRGPMIVNITEKTAPKPAGAPSVGELMGLADYLGELKQASKITGRRHTVYGRGDNVHVSAAAAHLAKSRAKQASNRVVRLQNAGFMPGFGADMQPDKTMDAALQIEKLAHQVAAMAQDVAECCAGASPVRQKALNTDLNTLDYIDRYTGVSDMVASVETDGASPRDAAKIKTETLREMGQDEEIRRGALAIGQPPVAKGRAPSVRTPMPFNAIVRDPNGNIIQNGNAEDEEGLANWHFHGRRTTRGDYQVAGGIGDLGSFFSKVKNKAQQVAHTVQNTIKQTVKSPKKLGLAIATGGLTTAYSATKGAVGTISPKAANVFDTIAKGALTGGISATVKGIQKAKQTLSKPKSSSSSAAPADQQSYIGINGQPITAAQYNATEQAMQSGMPVPVGDGTYAMPDGTYANEAQYQAWLASHPSGAAPVSVAPYIDPTTGLPTSGTPGADTYDPNAPTSDTYDPNTGASIVPQPGESYYDPSQDQLGPPTDSFGPDQMSAPSSADNSFMDEQSGGGNSDQVVVDDSYSGGDDGSGDASSEDGGTSDDSGADSSDDDATEGSDYNAPSAAPQPKKHRKHKRRNKLYDDSSDTDSGDSYGDDDGTDLDSDVATSDAYADMDQNEDGGAGDDAGSAMSPAVEGLGMSLSSGSVLVPLAIGAGLLYLLCRKK